MSIIVTDDGFVQEIGQVAPISLEELQVSDTAGHAIDLENDADLTVLAGFLDQISLIRVAFPSFADGRGFSIAKRLRLIGYRGALRAHGHLLSDQYPLARRSGFDAVEISDDLAARQAEAHWLIHSNWQGKDYQSRLRQAS